MGYHNWVEYEWDVEEVTACDSVDHEENEVLDHNFQSSYADCVAHCQGTPPDGLRFDIVLVCDIESCRCWAYLDAGKLPEFFEDAYGRKVRKVPQRFHQEVLKVAALQANHINTKKPA